jgi:hypothetical protein
MLCTACFVDKKLGGDSVFQLLCLIEECSSQLFQFDALLTIEFGLSSSVRMLD